MKTFRAFKIKYIPATDTKGSRVLIYDLRNNQRKIISYNYEFNSIYQIAENYLAGIGITCFGISEIPEGYILFSENFETQI